MPSPTPSPAASATLTVPRPVTSPSVAPYAWTSRPVTARDLPYSWHPGCPVAPPALRMLTLPYVGFDGAAHSGRLVVAARVVPAVTAAFGELYRRRFPIRRMVPVDGYRGSDDASVAADNTAGFNCRLAVTTGPASWSRHAYGAAIDVNPVENPYVEGGRVIPPAGAAFTDRSRDRPGMAEGLLVQAFARQGWRWGGRWSSPDYQHVSDNGR